MLVFTGCDDHTYDEYNGPNRDIVLLSTDIFSPMTIQEVSPCTYYNKDTIFSKSKNITESLRDMECIDSYMESVHDNKHDIIITNINYNEDATMYNAYFMDNDIIIDQPYITFEIQDNTVMFCSYIDDGSQPVAIESATLYEIDRARVHAANLAVEHREEILDPSAKNSSLNGCYYKLYHTDNSSLVYHFTLNNGSYIEIDATSGEVINTYFFNGIYY